MINQLARRRLEKRSPIERRLLPRAGASIRNHQIDRLLDGFGWCMGLIGATVGIGCWEGAAYFSRAPRHPLIAIAIAAVTFLICLLWMRRLWAQLEILGLGRQGEELMGQILEELRPYGYRAFHDLQGEDFNIDHVLVGPGGVFAIETKTISKRVRDPGKVVYDGERITVAGRLLDRDPLVQAKAGARHVREVLRRMSGREIEVKPVVVFPGWFVENAVRNGDVRVQNEKYFVKSMSSEPRSMADADVLFICAQLERYLRERSETAS